MIYTVTKGKAILAPKGSKLYLGGQELPTDKFTSAQIQRHLASGYLVATAGSSVELPAPAAPKKKKKRRSRAKPKPVEVASLWAIDPDGLRGHDLEYLNVMIAERDDKLDPFEDAAEAVAWLSQDYEAPE